MVSSFNNKFGFDFICIFPLNRQKEQNLVMITSMMSIVDSFVANAQIQKEPKKNFKATRKHIKVV